MNIVLRGVAVGFVLLSMVGCASKEADTKVFPLVLEGTRDPGDPAVVLLRNGSSACTGTIISPHHVLTAAHCVPRSSFSRSMSVSWARNRSEVTNVHLPPGANNLRNDIAVVEVADSMTVTPVAVNLDPRVIEDEMHVRLVGFGLTGTRRSDSGVKRQGEADVRRTESYLRTVPGTGGTCYGDSGGPALARVRGREAVVGVVSHGLTPRCENGSEFVRTDVHRAFLARFVGSSAGGGGGEQPVNPPPRVNPPPPIDPTPPIDPLPRRRRPAPPPPPPSDGDGLIAITEDKAGCQIISAPHIAVRICKD